MVSMVTRALTPVWRCLVCYWWSAVWALSLCLPWGQVNTCTHLIMCTYTLISLVGRDPLPTLGGRKRSGSMQYNEIFTKGTPIIKFQCLPVMKHHLWSPLISQSCRIPGSYVLRSILWPTMRTLFKGACECVIRLYVPRLFPSPRSSSG